MCWFRRIASHGILVVGGISAGAFVAVVSIVAAIWLDFSVPRYSAIYKISGISADVQIVRDRHAIPHIFAPTPLDAYFALGFVHAQDRLWQMEWQRRLAFGRLSEIVGVRALGADKLARLMRIGSSAEESLPLLTPQVREALGAYAAGVNAWIERAPALPPEFALLWFRPEPWRVADSLALLAGMAAQMSYNVRQELLVARAAQRLTDEELHDLFPTIERNAYGLDVLHAADEALTRSAALLEPFSRGASNVWALSGQVTTTGRPILANDPHMALAIPGIWYIARIEAPTLHLVGGTVPGLPFVVLGHNDRIAWGMTSSGMDVQDLFVERIDPVDRSRYLTPEGSRPFTVRHETIKVRGHADEKLTIRSTHHGPVLSDVGPRAAALADASSGVALSYTGAMAGDRTADAIFAINHATNWSEFRDAARLWSTPPQNLVMAAIDGTIGMTVAGRAPVRLNGDGRIPRPGWTGKFDWAGFVDGNSLPTSVNPASGRIIEANDSSPNAAGATFIGDPPESDLRARRIAYLLDQSKRHDVAMSVAIQNDIHAGDAGLLLPRLLRARSSDLRVNKAIDLLSRWDLAMKADRPEPLIYVSWLRSLTRKLFAPRLGQAFADYWDIHPTVMAQILDSDGSWCRNAGGTCEEVMGAAMADAVDELSAAYGERIDDWRWGAAHLAGFTHPVWSKVPGLRNLADRKVAVDGGGFTVGRAGVDFSRADAPYAAVTGASFRAVYDLSDLSRSRFVIASGESAIPHSPHYDDLIEAWRLGRSFEVAGSATELARDGLGTTILRRP